MFLLFNEDFFFKQFFDFMLKLKFSIFSRKRHLYQSCTMRITVVKIHLTPPLGNFWGTPLREFENPGNFELKEPYQQTLYSMI